MSTDGTGRQSALSHFLGAAAGGGQADGAAVVISERPFLGHLNLRGDPEDAGFTGAAENVLGLRLPTEPNTVAANGDLFALWLGPDEWHIVTPPAAQTALMGSLEAAFDGMHVAVTDVTGGQTVISVTGLRARDVLAKGCPLDLHPRVFKSADCAQTLLAKANVLIHCVNDSPTFELIVRRSFAEYTALWLHDAALEYGGGGVGVRDELLPDCHEAAPVDEDRVWDGVG